MFGATIPVLTGLVRDDAPPADGALNGLRPHLKHAIEEILARR